MAGDNSTLRYIVAYDQHVRSREVFLPAMERIRDQLEITNAETCISLGAGNGITETEFFRRCMPNLREFSAVECDHDSCESLSRRMQDQLPNVRSEVFEGLAEKWPGPEQPVDVVTLFHMLYYVRGAQRPEFYRKCFRDWLKPGGIALIVIDNDDSQFYRKVVKYLPANCGARNPANGEVIRKELREQGYRIKLEQTFRVEIDVNDADTDDNFLGFFMRLSNCDMKTVLEAVRRAGAEVQQHDECIIVVERAD